MFGSSEAEVTSLLHRPRFRLTNRNNCRTFCFHRRSAGPAAGTSLLPGRPAVAAQFSSFTTTPEGGSAAAGERRGIVGQLEESECRQRISSIKCGIPGRRTNTVWTEH